MAPADAVPRARRTESLVAVVKSIGSSAGALTAVLHAPPGVQLLESAEHRVASLEQGALQRFVWDFRAERPGRARFVVEVRDSDGRSLDEQSVEVDIETAREVTPAVYVPEPEPVESDYVVLSHYCPLWRYGAHSMGWDTIEPWPERRPALGFYDEGRPVVADWHIKYALEHGISGFIFTWDKIWIDQTTSNTRRAGIDAFLEAEFVDQAKFCINWADLYYESSIEELRERLFPYWLENYFKHPSYLTIDNRPVLFFNHPDKLEEWFGGRAAVRGLFDELRAKCRDHGFDGLLIVGCEPTERSQRLEALVEAGYDASSAYILWADLWDRAGLDVEGIPTFPHAEVMEAHAEVLAQKSRAALPDIVTVQMGWDSRPWHGSEATYYMEGTSPEHFLTACENAKRIVDSHPEGSLARRLVVLDNWNEFGEGHFIEPTSGYGFGFLDAVRSTFGRPGEPCAHLTPRDLAQELPENVFNACRGILHDPWNRERVIADGVIAHWSFDAADPLVIEDESQSGFRAFKYGVNAVEGVIGMGSSSHSGGNAILGVHDALYPGDGFTVELWVRPDAYQENAFVFNTAAEANTGYGIALRNGHVAFFLNWTQLAETTDPIPLDEWTHVAVASDNRTMAVFIDGEEAVRVPGAQRVVAPSQGTACIGAYNPGAVSFRGALDELKVHDRALSPERIRVAATRD